MLHPIVDVDQTQGCLLYTGAMFCRYHLYWCCYLPLLGVIPPLFLCSPCTLAILGDLFLILASGLSWYEGPFHLITLRRYVCRRSVFRRDFVGKWPLALSLLIWFKTRKGCSLANGHAGEVAVSESAHTGNRVTGVWCHSSSSLTVSNLCASHYRSL